MHKEVLVLFKTHLDMGFTDYAENIVKRYLEVNIPKAIEVGEELKGTDTPFVWTLGSWMVWEALKHDKDGRVDRAIRDGIITWHALPFTTHTELMSVELFEYALSISRKLDARYGKKTIAAKMTDVPGHTMGMVPLMKKNGIEFMHIGVNPATPLPDVPSVFKWECDGESIVVMYQKDYGLPEEFDDFVIYFAHTGDNLGPQSAEEVVAIYDKIQKEYPGCAIKAATLGDVAERVLKFKDIPVVNKEIGDTWIHGAGTDPEKVSRFRKVLRHIKEKGIKDEDLTDSLLIVPEHTWGKDIKKFFHNEKDYTVCEMEKVKDTDPFKDVEKSWNEQREYIRKAEALLGVTPDYPIQKPDLSGYEKCDIEDVGIEISWQLFDNKDYDIYNKTYMRLSVYWSIWDFTKVGLPEYDGFIVTANVTEMFKGNGEIICKMEFSKELAIEYGLPYFYLRIKDNNVEIMWFGKKASRLPQAFWLKFKGLVENWEVNKMGKWISPENIIDSNLICAVDEGIRNEKYKIKPLDSCLVAPYGRNLLRYKTESEEQDMYFNLYNNIWNTNFPMWYSDDALFRFEIDKI